MRNKSKFTWTKDERNTSEIYHTGSIWPTKKSGSIIILASYSSPSTGTKRYLVSFNDGTEATYQCNTIQSGKCFNNNLPTIRGIGCVGYGEYNVSTPKGHLTQRYKKWCHIINTYATKLDKNIEVYLKPSWKNFQHFCEDIKNIEGYTEWIPDSSTHILKQRCVKHNIFTPEAYIFKKKA